MLIEFRVDNYRSLRDEQVLTMEVARASGDNDSRPRQVEGHSERLLPVAALYGANASGKSNVLAALTFMRYAVTDSHRLWGPADGVPRDPFAWGSKRAEPSTFEATLLINAVRYDYGFSVNDEEFIEEWLYAWPIGKRQTWFERERGVFKFGENLKGENKLIAEITRKNALFLSAAAQHNHTQMMQIYWWFNSIRPVNLNLNHYRFPPSLQSEFLLAELIEAQRASSSFPSDLSSENSLNRFRTMLKSADVGILDLRIEKSEYEEGARRVRVPRFLLKHKCVDDDAWLPLEEESKGTRTLFWMAFPIIESLQEGSILLIDELESSLHPSLAQKIVRLFNDPSSNSSNAQLIFTTHDTNLLGTTLGDPVLRRDQVWLTEKTPEGATQLYPLSDFKPRKLENLERGYLQGRYGAIPFLDNFTVAAE